MRDPGATNGEGRLTMGDTHASDAFSFLPPGQPTDGAGECLVGRGVALPCKICACLDASSAL